jgi:hypothetical protein
MSCKSVFIGGLDRTGKTYLRFMLESHPEIIFSKRTSLWTKYYKKYGSIEKEEQLENLFNALAKNKHVMALSPDFKRLRVDFKPGPHSYERLFELIHQQYAEKNGRKFWGDQSEYLESYTSNILQAYPNAKFIHLIRDPRDRFAAILDKPKNRQGLGIATARWLNSTKLAQKNQTAFPNRYQVLRYETMVSSPEKTAMNICNFLGVEYETSMLRLDTIPRFKHQTTSEDQYFSPITNHYVGQFKNQLSQSQIAFIEKFTGKYMNEFHYQITDVRKTNKQSIADYIKTYPINLLQMFGWKLITQEGRV